MVKSEKLKQSKNQIFKLYKVMVLPLLKINTIMTTENSRPTSMVFYLSFMEGAIAAGLTPAQRAELYEGLMTYTFYHRIPEFSHPFAKGFFMICKENIDANTRKLERSRIASENGKKGGAPKGNKNAVKKTTSKKVKKVEEEVPVTEDTDSRQTPVVQEVNSTSRTEYNYAAQPVNDQRVQEQTTQNQASKQTYTNTNTLSNTNTSSSSSSLSMSLYQKEDTQKQTNLEIEENRRLLNLRRTTFVNSLIPYVKTYGMETIEKFVNYWTEADRNYLQMRFEQQSNWITEKRLARWMDNPKKMKEILERKKQLQLRQNSECCL